MVGCWSRLALTLSACSVFAIRLQVDDPIVDPAALTRQRSLGNSFGQFFHYQTEYSDHVILNYVLNIVLSHRPDKIQHPYWHFKNVNSCIEFMLNKNTLSKKHLPIPMKPLPLEHFQRQFVDEGWSDLVVPNNLPPNNPFHEFAGGTITQISWDEGEHFTILNSIQELKQEFSKFQNAGLQCCINIRETVWMNRLHFEKALYEVSGGELSIQSFKSDDVDLPPEASEAERLEWGNKRQRNERFFQLPDEVDAERESYVIVFNDGQRWQIYYNQIEGEVYTQLPGWYLVDSNGTKHAHHPLQSWKHVKSEIQKYVIPVGRPTTDANPLNWRLNWETDAFFVVQKPSLRDPATDHFGRRIPVACGPADLMLGIVRETFHSDFVDSSSSSTQTDPGVDSGNAPITPTAPSVTLQPVNSDDGVDVPMSSITPLDSADSVSEIPTTSHGNETTSHGNESTLRDLPGEDIPPTVSPEEVDLSDSFSIDDKPDSQVTEDDAHVCSVVDDRHAAADGAHAAKDDAVGKSPGAADGKVGRIGHHDAAANNGDANAGDRKQDDKPKPPPRNAPHAATKVVLTIAASISTLAKQIDGLKNLEEVHGALLKVKKLFDRLEHAHAARRPDSSFLQTDNNAGDVPAKQDAIWAAGEQDAIVSACAQVHDALQKAITRTASTHTEGLAHRCRYDAEQIDQVLGRVAILSPDQRISFSEAVDGLEVKSDAAKPGAGSTDGFSPLHFVWIGLGCFLFAILGCCGFCWWRRSQFRTEPEINPAFQKIYDIQAGPSIHQIVHKRAGCNPADPNEKACKVGTHNQRCSVTEYFRVGGATSSTQPSTQNSNDSTDLDADLLQAYPRDEHGNFIRDPKLSGPFGERFGDREGPFDFLFKPRINIDPPPETPVIDFKTAIPTHVKGTKMPFGDPSHINRQPDRSPAPDGDEADVQGLTDSEGNPIRGRKRRHQEYESSGPVTGSIENKKFKFFENQWNREIINWTQKFVMTQKLN